MPRILSTLAKGALFLSVLYQASLYGATLSHGADIRITPIQMIDENRDAKTVGALTWRGGFAMTMGDPRFGGLSALQVSADGASLLAVTDKGQWLRADLTYRDGNLAGIANVQLSPLLDLQGRPLGEKARSDAESLAQLGPNSFAVGFEREHRLWRYDGAPDPVRAPARPVPGPTRFGMLPGNGGIEALTTLCDGRLMAIAESSRKAQGSVEAWVQSNGGWKALTYPVVEGLRPTGATTLPGCDLLVLERSFSFIAGLEIRITRVATQGIDNGPLLQPREIARLLPPVSIDNFEGISARLTESGETLIYIVSDDNFSALQRTLLVMYQLDDNVR